jgi:hypothetical protein
MPLTEGIFVSDDLLNAVSTNRLGRPSTHRPDRSPRPRLNERKANHAQLHRITLTAVMAHAGQDLLGGQCQHAAAGAPECRR